MKEKERLVVNIKTHSIFDESTRTVAAVKRTTVATWVVECKNDSYVFSYDWLRKKVAVMCKKGLRLKGYFRIFNKIFIKSKSIPSYSS